MKEAKEVNPDEVIAELAVLEKRKQEAIKQLLKERDDFVKEINRKLSLLGYVEEQPKKRGRRPKPSEP